MSWIEAKSSIKFLCWGEIKPSIENEEDAVVVKVGESLDGIIDNIDEMKDKEGNIESYKYRIMTKEHDEPILVFSNASMRRQHESLGLKEGEVIRFTYVKDYKTKKGKPGREIKVEVDRD